MDLQNQTLLTDLYQLTMLQAYAKEQMHEEAVFELFFRGPPETRNFLVMAGLELVIDYLTSLHFSEHDIEWLRSTELFQDSFLEELRHFRFKGNVDALPEGRIFFGQQQPVLRITAPLSQAQFIESRIINLIHYSVLIASKAARCKIAAPTKQLVDFGFRRAHGAEAGLMAARSCYIAGFQGTATVAAGQLLCIPLIGTMAHSYIQAHDNEQEAFEKFAYSLPQHVVFLIDTYNVEMAAHKIVNLAPRLKEKGIVIRGVRLDSGDLADLSQKVRHIFDEAGLTEIKIISSGNLDEYALQDLMQKNAPIDSFGIGTRLVTSNDVPSLDAVYKLQEYADKPRCKFSPGKQTWPGIRQVYRFYDEKGMMSHDIVTLIDDESVKGEALLVPIIRKGERVAAKESLDIMQQRFLNDLNRLPAYLKSLEPAQHYPVEFSAVQRELADKLRAEKIN